MTNKDITLDAYIEFEKNRIDEFKQDWLRKREKGNRKDFPLSMPWCEWDEQLGVFLS